MNSDIEKIVLGAEATIKDVMSAFDKNAQGVIFLVDKDNVMLGVLTDGDVRRALLTSATLSDLAKPHMRREFVSGSIYRSREENSQLLNERIRHLPLLDDQGRIVDVIRWADFCRIPVMQPVLEGNEFKYVADCLVTNWISSQGPYVDRFQERFCQFLSVEKALCVANGTVALHLAMVALGIGPGDEVIIPDLTFVSPASMAIWCGATPVFADVDVKTWTIDPESIAKRITKRTRAIVAVHLYGHPCDMDPILEIAQKHGLFVIEDCAEALGAEYKGRKVGSIGDVGTFSFFANKVITTGEGGMVTTSNPELFEKMIILRDHGMTKDKRYWHELAGFNYRLTNLQAAIGLAQMEKIDHILAARFKIVARYNEHLSQLDGIQLPPEESWAKNIFWLYSVIIDESITGIDRDRLAIRLSEYGVDTRPFFHPLHQQPPFQSEASGAFPNATRLATRGLSLPTSNDIDFATIDKVCHAIKSEL